MGRGDGRRLGGALYWERRENGWHVFTLHGEVPVDRNTPVCHVSFFEAEAFARWANARLPTEAEWEVAARDASRAGNFLESGALHPLALRGAPAEGRLAQAFGDVWEWTRSDYGPYPGYRAAAGAVGEYNGKFMCGQYVLRGGSCVTPAAHVRATYRNSFRRRHAGSSRGCASLGKPESSIADGGQPSRRAVLRLFSAAPRATRDGSVRIAAMILHFSHANGFPAACYRKIFSFLERDFEIRYVNTIGHDPRHPVIDSWLHLVAEQLEHIDRYGQPVLGVGHSLGGYLTMLAALERPELFRAIVVLDSPVIGRGRAGPSAW